MFRISLLIILAIPQLTDGQIDRNRKWPAYRSGTFYLKALEQPLSSTWKNRSLRNILLKISRNSKVAILLDRRIDPSRLLDISLDTSTLRQGLQEIGRQVGAEASFADGFVYLGPKENTKKLRTLIYSRVRELQNAKVSPSSARMKSLLRRGRFEWNDLDSPKEILENLSRKHAIKIEGIEQIPHDLWFGASLPYASFVDVLSIVSIQFDRTFRWSADLKSVEIVGVPERVFVERTYRAKKGNAEQYAKSLRDSFRESHVEVRGDTVVVKALLDTHDAIAQMRKTPRKKSSRQKKRTLPLSATGQDSIDLRASPRSLFPVLKKSDIHFEFDEDQMKAAGVNLDSKIIIKKRKMSDLEFVKEICRQMGVDYEISGRIIKLKPKK